MTNHTFSVHSIDHIVLAVNDVAATLAFYTEILGMEPREERPGKWALHFGTYKISLQDLDSIPDIAKGTLPGSGNFALLSDVSVDQWVTHLKVHNIPILAGPGTRIGATGPIKSIYFNDPDGNLVEVSNKI